MEILTFIMLFLVITIVGFYVYQTNKLIKGLQVLNSDLLNRLMARDYKEYAVFEHNKEVLKVESVAQKIMQPEQDVYRVD